VVDKGDVLEDASRRRFLETTVLAGIAGLSPAAGAMVSPPPRTRAWFAPFVGTAFTVRDRDGASVQLVLSALMPLPHAVGYASAAQAAERCFVAQFRGAHGLPQVAGLCEVEHPQLGRFDMMIAPIGGGGRTWEAVFNRLQLA
jgi:hypothetical protein